MPRNTGLLLIFRQGTGHQLCYTEPTHRNPATIQYLLVGSCVKVGKLTKCSTYTFAELTLMSVYPLPPQRENP